MCMLLGWPIYFLRTRQYRFGFAERRKWYFVCSRSWTASPRNLNDNSWRYGGVDWWRNVDYFMLLHTNIFAGCLLFFCILFHSSSLVRAAFYLSCLKRITSDRPWIWRTQSCAHECTQYTFCTMLRIKINIKKRRKRRRRRGKKVILWNDCDLW